MDCNPRMLVLAVFPGDSVLSSFHIRAMRSTIRLTVSEFQNLRTLLPLLSNSVPNQAKVTLAFFWDEIPITIIMSIEISKEKNSTLVRRWVTPSSINHPPGTSSSKALLNGRKSSQNGASKPSQPEVSVCIRNVILFLYLHAFTSWK